MVYCSLLILKKYTQNNRRLFLHILHLCLQIIHIHLSSILNNNLFFITFQLISYLHGLGHQTLLFSLIHKLFTHMSIQSPNHSSSQTYWRIERLFVNRTIFFSNSPFYTFIFKNIKITSGSIVEREMDMDESIVFNSLSIYIHQQLHPTYFNHQLSLHSLTSIQLLPLFFQFLRSANQIIKQQLLFLI